MRAKAAARAWSAALNWYSSSLPREREAMAGVWLGLPEFRAAATHLHPSDQEA